jgi:hypothetical protein
MIHDSTEDSLWTFRRRTLPVLLLMFAVIALEFPEFVKQPQLDTRYRLIVIALLALAMIMQLFDYLQGPSSLGYERSSPFRTEELFDRIHYELRNLGEELRVGIGESGFQKEIAELRNLLKHQSGQLQFTDAEKLGLMDGIRTQIGATLGDEFVKLMDQRYATVAIKKSRHESMVRDFEVLRQRLLEEVRALQRRANSNLAIGSITTLLAMSSLAFVVLRAMPDFHSTASVASYYLPRITFVIFIEVFAFFFLRLYKVSLDDIKFYQNELTNVECRIIALRAALVDENQNGLTKILGELAATERNFVLKKGETTVDLERRRVDVAGEHAVLQHIAGAIEKLKPKA